MYRSIMVPLDGSEFSEKAMPLALSIARRAHAELLLVEVVEPLVPAVYALSSVTENGTWNARALDREAAHLAPLAGRVMQCAGVRARVSVLHGAVAPTLLHEAHDGPCDLIVMTTHGRGALGKFFLGSVADKLARKAPCPVLFVPRNSQMEWTDDHSFKHVLVPLDGSQSAEKVLPFALKMAALDGARVTMLHVAHPGMNAHPYLPAVDVPSRTFTDVLIDDGPPAAVIMRYAREHDVDLIAMTADAHDALPRGALGSVADKVVRHADVAVMVASRHAIMRT